MAFHDNLIRKRDGSYTLKHKTKKHKKGECLDCGENAKDRALGGLYRFKTDDMLLIRQHIEDHLTFYSSVQSITPEYCNTCQSLKQYISKLHSNKSNFIA